MKRCKVGFFTAFLLLDGVGLGQTTRMPANYIEIQLPSGVASEDFFVRYVLAGDDLGGWVQSVAGVSSYVINTEREGLPSAGIKAILYAPGCAVQTLDLALSAFNNPRYPFICQPLGTVRISGTLARIDRLYGRGVKVQAKYVARWATRFLGLDDIFVIAVPMGHSILLPADDRFTLTVPDLSADPLAGTPDHPGELQIWAKDPTGETVIAQLIPTGPLATRMGGLKISGEYSSDIIFAPCLANTRRVRDRATGFSLRPGRSDACDR